MKINKFKLLANLFLAAFLAFALVPYLGEAFALTVGAVLFASGFIPKPMHIGVLNLLETQVWEKDIQEALWPGNEFMKYAIDNSENIVGGNVVHRPQAGTIPGVKKNRKEFPAKIIKADDTDETYNIDNYTSDPVLLRGAEEQWLSYEKRSSIMKRQNSVLNYTISQNLLFNWTPTLASNIVRTSGAADATLFNLGDGCTGTRKATVRKDLANLAKKMNNMKVPSYGRYLLMPSEMYLEVFDDDNLALAMAMGNMNMFPTGVVKQLYNFNIIVRPQIGRFTNDATPQLKALNDDGNPTFNAADNLYALAWHEEFVDRAVGDIKVRIDEEGATTFGSVLSAELNAGGQKMRQTIQVGMAVLVQGQ